MSASQLPLRDVHLPAAPGWWPPAPGWWWVMAVLLLVCMLATFFWWKRWRQQRIWQALFDDAINAAQTPSARLAVTSDLLRRAAKRFQPGAENLQSDAWLQFLDGKKHSDFSQGSGRLLLDGGYRRDVDATDAARACALARTRFLELMGRGR